MSDEPNAAPAAAGRRLEDDGVADPLGRLQRLRRVLERELAARDDGHAGLLGDHARLGLVAHEPDRFGRGADEGDGAGAAHLGERGVLGQESVAGMDRLAVGDGRGGDDGRDVQVAEAGRVRADADGLVGSLDGQGGGVGLGVGDDRADAELAAGADDPQRDLAPVRDENLVEHGRGPGPGPLSAEDPAPLELDLSHAEAVHAGRGFVEGVSCPQP